MLDPAVERAYFARGSRASARRIASAVARRMLSRSISRVLAARYPDYGWDRNCGYGTPKHRAAIELTGVTPHHRRSFTPVLQRELFV